MVGKVDKKEEESKISSMKVNYQDRDTVSPTFGKFPMKLWSEWDQDCEVNYNGTRWFKAWSDHQTAKQNKKEEAMWGYMMDLNDKVDSLLKQPPQEEEEVDENFVATIGNPTPKKRKKKVKKNE